MITRLMSAGARAGGFAVRLLWPARCTACAELAELVDEYAAFCALCQLAAVRLGAACPGCAVPRFGGEAGGDVCASCRTRPFPFRRARAVFVYGGAVADAVVRLKHGSSSAPARPLGRLLAPLIDWAAQAGADLALPVPLHPRRLRARGFNQALELLRAAQPRRPLRVAIDLLQRQRDTEALGHLPPLARRHRVTGAFQVPHPARVAGRRVLLVDDVMTTGATFAACAETLFAAGATDVLVVALARTIAGAGR